MCLFFYGGSLGCKKPNLHPPHSEVEVLSNGDGVVWSLEKPDPSTQPKLILPVGKECVISLSLPIIKVLSGSELCIPNVLGGTIGINGCYF
jgi:hypothetical protein